MYIKKKYLRLRSHTFTPFPLSQRDQSRGGQRANDRFDKTKKQFLCRGSKFRNWRFAAIINCARLSIETTNEKNMKTKIFSAKLFGYEGRFENAANVREDIARPLENEFSGIIHRRQHCRQLWRQPCIKLRRRGRKKKLHKIVPVAQQRLLIAAARSF